MTLMRTGQWKDGLIDFCNFIKMKEINPITIVEIGSYLGESAEIFANQFSDCKIYCIDPWEGGFDEDDWCSKDNYSLIEREFDLRCKKYPNLIKMKGYSDSFRIITSGVYIDGNHQYEQVKKDILHWKDLCLEFIAGHDYYDDLTDRKQPHTAGVRKAVNEIIGIPDAIFQDGSWIKILG